MRTCSIDGCDRPRKYRHWCGLHYQRWVRHGDPSVVTRVMDHPDTCTIDGCDRPYKARGFCGTHWTRLLRHGDAYAHLPVGTPFGANVYHIEPMPCQLDQGDRLAAAKIPTATEASAARHLAAWWAMDARIQAANDAHDAAPLAAD